MLVTFERYRDITGDRLTDQSLVTARLEEAQAMIEQETHRFLESAQRTETLPVDRYGYVRPHAYPITGVGPAETATILDEVTLRGAVPDDVTGWAAWSDWERPQATVTYTGGYTTVTVPRKLARAIALVAQALAIVNPIPQGATSATVGDVSVEFAHATEALGALVPGLDNYVQRLRYRGTLAS